MDPRDFDEILRQKLKGLEKSSAPIPDWDRMEKDLDSQKDQMFDEQVKRKLEQLTVSNFSKSNWSTLYELINTRVLRKRAVLTSKAFELSIFALFLFVIVNLGWLNEYKKDIYYADSFEKPEVSGQKSNIEVAGKMSTSIDLDLKKSNKFQSESIALNKNQVDNQNIDFHNSEVIKRQSKDVASNNAVSTLNTLAIPLPQSIVSASSSSDLFAEAKIEQLSQTRNKVNDSKLDVYNIHGVVANESDINLKTLYPVVNGKEGKKAKRFFAEGGVDIAYANIESVFRNLPSRNAIPVDNSTNKLYPIAFLNAGVEFSKASVNTGIEVQRISYNPAVSYISGQFSENITTTDFDEFRYDIVSIPLNISWNLLSFNNWNMQVNTGFVSNIISNVDISANQSIRNGDRVTYPENIDYSSIPVPLSKGVFDEPANEISSTFSPVYFQTRTGLQLKRKLNFNTSIIANFNYNYQLPLLNQEERDSFNTYSLGLSVRKYLG